MADALRDQDHVTVGMGISSSDSTTTLMLSVDAVTNYLLIDIATDSLTPTSATVVKRDQNFVPTYYGISETDSTTLVPIRTDTDGKLLVELAP